MSERERVGGSCLALFLWRLEGELLLLVVLLLLLLLEVELERDLDLELLLLRLSSSSLLFFLDFFLLFLDFLDFFFFFFFLSWSALNTKSKISFRIRNNLAFWMRIRVNKKTVPYCIRDASNSVVCETLFWKRDGARSVPYQNVTLRKLFWGA
jgi:hypothetical protein